MALGIIAVLLALILHHINPDFFGSLFLNCLKLIFYWILPIGFGFFVVTTTPEWAMASIFSIGYLVFAYKAGKALEAKFGDKEWIVWISAVAPLPVVGWIGVTYF